MSMANKWQYESKHGGKLVQGMGGERAIVQWHVFQGQQPCANALFTLGSGLDISVQRAFECCMALY